ncbi:UspA domain-containing protein [Salinarchaeum sp. Harcht-Bsk1]|nr:UspA domain-containing protein [Salinarchaeum sp. Harcht-Bsk1]
MFDSILVVTNGTDPGSRPAERAVALAETHDAELHALYVVDVAKDWDMAVERREAEGEAAVEFVANRGAERDVPVVKHFRYGRTHEEIVDYAAAHEVDLVVVPSTTRRGLSRMLAPTDLAERVIGRTDVPVLGIDVADATEHGSAEEAGDGANAPTVAD